jgi:hypothetical protein
VVASLSTEGPSGGDAHKRRHGPNAGRAPAAAALSLIHAGQELFLSIRMRWRRRRRAPSSWCGRAVLAPGGNIAEVISAVAGPEPADPFGHPRFS